MLHSNPCFYFIYHDLATLPFPSRLGDIVMFACSSECCFKTNASSFLFLKDKEKKEYPNSLFSSFTSFHVLGSPNFSWISSVTDPYNYV